MLGLVQLEVNMNKLLILLALLLVACGEATPTPTVPPVPTPAFNLPAGYVAYQNVTVLVVDIDMTSMEGEAAQQAVIDAALSQKLDVLVIGCIAVDASVSSCPTTPFMVFGSRVPASGKQAMR